MRTLRKRVMLLLLALALCLPAMSVQADSADLSNVVVDGGVSHSIALSSNGNVYVWGSNAQLQLAMKDPDAQQTSPVKVSGLNSMVAVAAGHDFSVALRFDGAVYTWGGGKQSTPTAVDGLSDIAAIAAGQTGILALDQSGRVWQWSIGGVPSRVAGLNNIVAIDAGGSHYLALTISGDVYAWGDNWSGQLGTGDTTSNTAPQKLNIINIIDIAAGQTHSLALAFDGTIYAWGSNTYGQLGNGTTVSSNAPVKASSIENAVQISAGSDTSMARTKDGKIYTWGHGEYGQLGRSGAPSSQNTPKVITKLSEPAAFIACGVYHNLCVSQNGGLYAWGRNKDYQLAAEQNSNVETPRLVDGLKMMVGNSYNMGNALSGPSFWALEELQTLYGRNVISPMMWQNFQGITTRAEFVHILITVYEKVKNTIPVEDTDFKDIRGHLYETDIIKAKILGITAGTTPTTFSPENPLTRQEAVKMLCILLAEIRDIAVPQYVPNVSYYTDAYAIKDWALPYVAFAHNENIMQGSSSKFNPDDFLTREQSLLIVGRAIEKYQWY